MSEQIQDLGQGFRTIRGSFKIAGMVDVGTQCSLVEMSNGEFVFLDSYTLPDEIRDEVYELTDNGRKVSAIINVHPFHTIHCEWMHRAFPQAKLYGTARHHRKWPDLPWQDATCEGTSFPGLFRQDFEFSQPAGCRLVCEDENVHFSSILVYHPASRTIHVDDTLSYLDAAFPLSLLPMTGRLDFHPTLGKALEQRAGAADDFREWAYDIGVRWADARQIAAAHNSVVELEPESFPDRIGEALGRVKKTLDEHREKYG